MGAAWPLNWIWMDLREPRLGGICPGPLDRRRERAFLPAPASLLGGAPQISACPIPPPRGSHHRFHTHHTPPQDVRRGSRATLEWRRRHIHRPPPSPFEPPAIAAAAGGPGRQRPVDRGGGRRPPDGAAPSQGCAGRTGASAGVDAGGGSQPSAQPRTDRWQPGRGPAGKRGGRKACSANGRHNRARSPAK